MRQLLPQSFFVLVGLTIVAFLGLIQACQTVGVEQFTKVQSDMTKDDVLDILGSPNRTERFDGKEKWAYRYYSGSNEELRQVTFVNGRVVSVGEDAEEIQRIKDIQESDKKRLERRKAAKLKSPASLVEESPAAVETAPAQNTSVEGPAKPNPSEVEYEEVKGKRGPIEQSAE
jgi:outer membrane protein assembly factor BamE (lipoprotein component of BamABCDE complex)